MKAFKSYQILLSTMQSVRSTLRSTTDIRLAQIVVIGDQSAGKSSVMTEITGVRFPKASGMCTKCPIVVHTKRNISSETLSFKVKCGSKEEKVDNMDSFVKTITKMNEGHNKITETPIQVIAEGPCFQDIVLVDLPGIVHNDNNADDVERIVNKYIKPEESLILVVTEAKQDTQGAKALQLAKKVDPDEKRTLRVMTKFDCFDSEEARKRACVMIKTGLGASPLFPHAVIAQPKGKAYSEKQERAALSCIGRDEACGIPNLKKRLPQLLCELIRSNLPGLVEQLEKKIKTTKCDLEKIGDVAPNKHELLERVRSHFFDKFIDLWNVMSSTHDTFREEIHDTEKKIDAKFIESHFHHTVFDAPFFQGNEAFEACLRAIVDEWWTPPSEKMMMCVRKEFENVGTNIIMKDMSEDIKSAVLMSWRRISAQIQERLRACIEREMTKERTFKTSNHYLTSKYEENLTLPEEVRYKLIKEISLNYIPYAVDKDVFDKKLKGVFFEKGGILERHFLNFSKASLHDQQKARVLAAVRANWGVAKKNVTDSVLSELKSVKGACETWLKSDGLMGDIWDVLNESPAIARRRSEYKTTLTEVKKCLDLLRC